MHLKINNYYSWVIVTVFNHMSTLLDPDVYVGKEIRAPILINAPSPISCLPWATSTKQVSQVVNWIIMLEVLLLRLQGCMDRFSLNMFSGYLSSGVLGNALSAIYNTLTRLIWLWAACPSFFLVCQVWRQKLSVSGKTAARNQGDSHFFHFMLNRVRKKRCAVV